MLPGVRIVIAPDSFKGSLAADQATAAIAAGIGRCLASPAEELTDRAALVLVRALPT
jgi:glycerate kinase